MKKRSSLFVSYAAAALLAVALTGCVYVQIKKVGHGGHHDDSCCKPNPGDMVCEPALEMDGQLPGDPPPGSEKGPPTPSRPGHPPTHPTGNSGTLTVATGGSIANNATTGCFLKSKGWDRYISVPAFFWGPGSPSVPGMPNIPNADNLTYLRVQTCNSANVTPIPKLETGIVIYRDDNPSVKKCRTNALDCNFSTLLSTNVYAMSAGCYYRATVYYKSATVPAGLTQVSVDWFYE